MESEKQMDDKTNAEDLEQLETKAEDISSNDSKLNANPRYVSAINRDTTLYKYNA